ncbi:hypothetical protein PIB30_001560 [Stylosanthes scabra]|uniref:Uncharacterized protein n=1 Tax=Stylosanthes scabra TaxID=79078 RepID=A0ABU6R415_9FABA|nr:hypothetical protein [Stylosanthes scabra]
MDTMACNKGQHVRKAKKKQKQKKKEEQQRLDEEGAAIAEAVALHVLLGEDSEDSCKVVINDETCKTWNCDRNLDFFVGGERACFPHLHGGAWSVETRGWVTDAYRYGCKWGAAENGGWTFSSEPLGRNAHEKPLYEDATGWGHAGFSADLIAAQAVSSLQIAEADEERIIF